MVDYLRKQQQQHFMLKVMRDRKEIAEKKKKLSQALKKLDDYKERQARTKRIVRLTEDMDLIKYYKKRK